ncbi:MAG TPA: LytTR family DNA-binding domain-containing protein [Gemmatimonadaceae bacterium]|nr:LytTR family DNA-binding domain-containing protein [Gemmatimonadaceae bacterium]
MTTAIRVLIVDDEPLARAHLRNLLSSDQEIEIVGEHGNGRDAVAAIREETPDLVLLDVQMPELDGFEVVRQVGVDEMPTVIFVTAYDEYALKAFEAQALDYVMKPVNRTRFRAAVERAKEVIRAARASELRVPLGRLLEAIAAERRYLDRIAIRTDGRIIFLRTDQIDWLEADDDHVRLHVGPKRYLHRDTLSRLEQRLSPNTFLRIHRSVIVNVERIREMQPWFQGDYVLILHDGTKLTSGRSYREKVRALVERAR